MSSRIHGAAAPSNSGGDLFDIAHKLEITVGAEENRQPLVCEIE
ncbi:hypothetical protein [Rhizobium sp. 57MFTsu3.2]|nr:hypothetical protein [Rhizobium sp. 57MFTsu3.2]